MKHFTLAIAIMFAMTGLVWADYQVTVTNNATTLANTLISDPNIVLNSATYTGGAAASGTFIGGNSAGLVIDKGILLTSGSAACTDQGPGQQNLNPNCSVTTGVGGSYIGGSTDETSLVIKFTPLVNAIVSFEYIFGSEEYPEWVGSQYNDAFKFFLNGTNIALIPFTTTPVEINTVNAGSNSQYYSGPVNLVAYDDYAGNYAGMFGLDASGAVNVGVENTLVLTIADRGDSIYDSGVFLKGFVNASPTIPEPGTWVLLATVLGGLAAQRKFRKTA